jgi:putative sterol carrier protein
MLGEGGRMPDLGDIHQNWAKIDILKGSQEYPDATAALMDMAAGPKPVLEEAPLDRSLPSAKRDEGGAATPAASRTSSVRAVFDNIGTAFQPAAAAGVDVVFQFRISGPGGGDWYTAIKDGACTVASGIHDKPTTTLKMLDDDFIRYVSGQLPAMQAYSTGKLKIEGDLRKSQLVEKLFKF